MPKVIAIIGQPNSGKSTLFNVLSDIKSNTSNFAGDSFEINESLIDIYGTTVKIIDLPGIYSLNPSQNDALNMIEFLRMNEIDAVIDVVDSTILSRSLELTIELLEVGFPMVVALNMNDEAENHGLVVDSELLSAELALPVIKTSAIHGKGVKELIEAALGIIENNPLHRKTFSFSQHIEQGVLELATAIGELRLNLPSDNRFYAIKAIECPELLPEGMSGKIDDVKRKIESDFISGHGTDPFEIISSERHHISMKLSEQVSTFKRRRTRPLSEKLDDFLLHPRGGYFFLAFFLFLYFFSIFIIGTGLSSLIEIPLEALADTFEPLKQDSPFLWNTLNGAYMGLAGIAGIVLPYFLPLVFLSSLFEESGYMARIAFLADGFFHKIGLHGKSAVPFILGFGCSVPAIYASRIIERRRDRIVTGMLIPFIPCSARIAVIFSLTAAFAGPVWAIIVFLYVGLVLSINGKILSIFLSKPIGLILEIPRLMMPSLTISFKKTYQKIYIFLKEAFIFLITGSIILGWLEYFKIYEYLNPIFSPIIHFVLGLPEELGSTLLFGFFRKELIIVMATQALGVDTLASLPTVLSLNQVIVFIVFVTFYFPCLTTFVVIIKEFGKKTALFSAMASILIATASGLLFRIVISLIY